MFQHVETALQNIEYNMEKKAVRMILLDGLQDGCINDGAMGIGLDLMQPAHLGLHVLAIV